MFSKKIYPYLYSADVVDAFLGNYGRAAIFIAKKCHMGPADFRQLLIKRFMYNNRRWHVLKDALKAVHRNNLYDVIAPMTRGETIKYLTAVCTLIEDDFIENGWPEK